MVVFLILRSTHLARYYEPSLRLLADRGHLVHIGFPFKPKGGDRLFKWVREYRVRVPGESGDDTPRDLAGVELLSRMARDHPNISWGYLRQLRTDGWNEMLFTIRICHDFLRFFDADYKDAEGLRERAIAQGVPPFFQRLMRNRVLRSELGLRFMRRFLLACERAVPVSRSAIDEIVDVMPEVVLVSRLVDVGCIQHDYVRAARYLGVPVGLPVASWDNLTNKGLLKTPPDFVTVWNEFQKREAADYHGMPEDRIWVTGAQNFDVWFGRQPSINRAAFCQRFGFDPERPLIAYLCSSLSIAGDEVAIVRRWLAGLRRNSDPLVRNSNVVIRPHPYHVRQWVGVDFSDSGPVEIWPRAGAIPLTEEQRDDFYDTLYHAGAIVGLNTSAQVEAAILGRPVLVLIDPSATASRKGTLETLHFRYLSDPEQGIATVAETADAHFIQLGEAVRRAGGERSMQFVHRFLRPHGLERPAAPILADAIERGAQTRPSPARRSTPLLLALRMLLTVARPILAPKRQRKTTPQSAIESALRAG